MLPAPSFTVDLVGGGKKYFRNWIFRHLSFHLEDAQKVSIIGPNGSGKSTLLQVFSGFESLSEGTFVVKKNGNEIPRESIFSHVSIAAPYLELIEEFTLEEIITFHFQFKKPSLNLSCAHIVAITQLEDSRKKVFKYFSSGMKQRVKLALAVISDVDLLLLDEPLSNLDKSGALWYRNLFEKYLKEKAVIVCSNQNEDEYFFCNQTINISEYK
jgi:ABC-type multidrug transport system ATPase subunit